jgi:hypothetical protein
MFGTSCLFMSCHVHWRNKKKKDKWIISAVISYRVRGFLICWTNKQAFWFAYSLSPDVYHRTARICLLFSPLSNHCYACEYTRLRCCFQLLKLLLIIICCKYCKNTASTNKTGIVISLHYLLWRANYVKCLMRLWFNFFLCSRFGR